MNAGNLRLLDDASLLGSEYAALAQMNALIEINPALRRNMQAVPAFEMN